MTVHIVTIVLDGMPFIAAQWAAINRINREHCEWKWHVSHGVAKPTNCTSWCKPIEPRLSKDGTSEFLEGIRKNPNVNVYEKPEWEGKIEMVNAGLGGLKKGDVVIQMDSDELWTARQIEMISHMLNVESERNAMQFRCRYFVGPGLVIKGYDGYGNHTEYEWRRAWKVDCPMFRFTRHEPPQVSMNEVWIGHKETENLGLVFDHYAYVLESQVSFKQKYYGYHKAVKSWRNLQSNTTWPAKLSDFLPWVKDGSTVDIV